MPNVTPDFDNFETVDATVDTDNSGIATAHVSYYARDNDTMLALLRSGKVCPFVTDGILSSARFLHGSANTEEGGVWKVSLYWKGAGASLRLEVAAIPKYTPIGNTAPIDTHPLFEKFAGTPEAPLNNAQFDSQYSFVRFPPFLDDGVTINPKSGVKNYYQAMLSVGETRVIEQTQVASEADWFNVGKISKPEIEDMAEIRLRVIGMDDQIRNHLLTEITLDDLGNGYASMDRKWDMSGPFGWDEDIYAYDDTGDAKDKTY